MYGRTTFPVTQNVTGTRLSADEAGAFAPASSALIFVTGARIELATFGL